MIKRVAERTLRSLAKEFPVAVVTGPRQSGKSTLVQSAFPEKPYITFDEIDVLESARTDPRGFLDRFPKGAIVDEAQKLPELFPYVKARVDHSRVRGEFILTGSQQFGFMSHVSESLAGRAGFVQLLPFSLYELSAAKKLPPLDQLLFQGTYPPLYDRNITARHWHAAYITTYLERDVRTMLNIRELSTFQRFLRMCAARTGQLLNISSLANDCGISTPTARNWMSVLEASYIIFLLQPHFSNFGKRLVKTPKLYFHDTGLAAWLLNIQDPAHLSIHPSRGALFENLIISELLKQRFNRGMASNLYFWRDNLGDEIDVLIDHGTTHIPVEIKSGQTLTDDYFKTLNKWEKVIGQHIASFLIYAGNTPHTRHRIAVVPWRSLPDLSVAP